MTLATIRAKANSHYRCQECDSTELIQAHHEIPGDDNSLIALCAECHSKRHPDLPRALFFNKGIQPYWHNKSASSLARKWGVASRTVIRTAKRLGISIGELSPWDEELIKSNIPKLILRSQKATRNKWRILTMTGKEIIELREKLKMTQQELADVIGVDRVTVARWETSKKRPSRLATKQLDRLAKK